MKCAIAITSGKGGVGKTNAATNIGIALTRLGRKVCIFDADLGLSNVNIITGQAPAHTVEQLLDGERSLEEIVMEGPASISVVPSGSGIESLTELNPERMDKLKSALNTLNEQHDYLLIDTAAGIGSEVMWFVKSARAALVVVSPEPTSLTDAYALIKVLHRQGFEREIHILVNMAASAEEAQKLFASLKNAAGKFLGRELSYLGHVLRDYALASSVIKQTPVTVLYPESAASGCFADVAARLDGAMVGNEPAGGAAHQGYGEALAQTVSGEADSKKATTPRTGGAEVIPLVKRRGDQGRDEGFVERRKGFGGPSLEELCRRIETGEVDEEIAAEAIARLENSYVRRFGKPYFDLRSGIYSALDFAEVTSTAIKEVAMLLESIHERRFGEPLFGLEETMLKALADCDSEAKMLKTMRTLETGYMRRFGKSPMELERLIEREAQEGRLTRGRMQDMADLLDALHRERFGAALMTQGSVRTEDIEELLASFSSNDELFQALNRALVEFRSDREHLKRRLEELTAGVSLAKVRDNESEG